MAEDGKGITAQGLIARALENDDFGTSIRDLMEAKAMTAGNPDLAKKWEDAYDTVIAREIPRSLD